ncbi:MAG: SDR family NAD(P)-dependent oxidoreductase, partial [Pseudomonadota bacterium]
MPKRLFIKGASSGIGAATARAVSAVGWEVGLFARSEDKLNALANELNGATVLPGDVTKLDEIDAAMEAFGDIDAVFANAGKGLDTPGTEAGDPEAWHDLIHVNVMGVLYTAKAAMPRLRARKGHMVLTGSAAGRRHIKGSVY